MNNFIIHNSLYNEFNNDINNNILKNIFIKTHPLSLLPSLFGGI